MKSPVSAHLKRGPSARRTLQRCACGGTCAECSEQSMATRADAGLSSPWQRLDASTRSFMELRFGADFGGVRVHTDQRAAESARGLRALAYTVGNDIVFRAGHYSPRTETGNRLLAHELAHVRQQDNNAELPLKSAPPVGSKNDALEREAVAAAEVVAGSGTRVPAFTESPSSAIVRLQADDSDGGIPNGVSDSGSDGLADAGSGDASLPGGVEDGVVTDSSVTNADGYAAAPCKVCARELKHGGILFNHTYVVAPGAQYAILGPTCPANWYDSPLFFTTGQKWDHSTDPCGHTPTCIPCYPKGDGDDASACLRNAFDSYPSLSKYSAPFGPNSNTFAGTLARACCSGMIPQPARLGWVPHWDDAPAPPRAGGTPCPPGPDCDAD